MSEQKDGAEDDFMSPAEGLNSMLPRCGTLLCRQNNFLRAEISILNSVVPYLQGVGTFSNKQASSLSGRHFH